MFKVNFQDLHQPLITTLFSLVENAVFVQLHGDEHEVNRAKIALPLLRCITGEDAVPEIAIHVFPTLDVVHSYVGQRTQFLLCLLSSIGSGFTKITSDDWGPALANAAGCLGILVKLDCWLELISDAVSAWSACLSAGLVSSEKMKEVAEMETARLKTEKVAKELLAAQTSQTSAAICKTTEQGPQHASIEKLLHDMLPAIGKDDPDYLDGSVIPAFFFAWSSSWQTSRRTFLQRSSIGRQVIARVGMMTFSLRTRTPRRPS